MDHDQLRELLEAYALGALDSDEAHELEQHLPTCADCQRELASYRELVAGLPGALAVASPLRPPESLRTRVFEAVSGTSRTIRVPPIPQTSHPCKRRWLPELRSLRPRTAVMLAAVLVALISLAWSARLSLALAHERAQLERFAGLVEQQELILEVVDSNETHRAVLLPSSEGSRSYGKVFIRPDLPHVVAMAARLPEAPRGQTYYLWLTRESGTERYAMPVNEEGFGLVVIDTPDAGPAFERAQLTLQAEGGESPAGTPIIEWEAAPGG